MNFDLLLEGDTDEIVVKKILLASGHGTGTVFGKNGIGSVQAKAFGLSRRALHGTPVLIVADFMDLDEECPGQAALQLVPNAPELCLVRLAVPEIESWVMASRKEFAEFLNISISHIPEDTDSVADAKQTLVNLARKCRNKRKREAFVPLQGSSATIGPGYVDEIASFMQTSWNLESAKIGSNSLRRAIIRLDQFHN